MMIIYRTVNPPQVCCGVEISGPGTCAGGMGVGGWEGNGGDGAKGDAFFLSARRAIVEM